VTVGVAFLLVLFTRASLPSSLRIQQPPPTSSKAPANETAADIEQLVPTSEFTTLDLNNTGQATSMARVYADVNANMPRAYWDYDSVNISWGVLENYEVVRKIGMLSLYYY